MKKHHILILLLVFSFRVNAQDRAFGKQVVDTLTAPIFWGRGYTKNGMVKAAGYINNRFKEFGLVPLSGTNYLQSFTYSVNTFPGKMMVSLNGKKLIPGKDFIISPGSRGIKAHGDLTQSDSNSFVNPKSRVFVRLKEKLTWSVDENAADFTSIEIINKILSGPPRSFNINIENEVDRNFKALNVCSMVKGLQNPDSFIFITAHYDHLGGMGKDTYFPGANDNASGISLLLNLARYYAKNPQKYSIGFICFGGEEAGLKGSRYFTEHPLVPLKNIRFLINTDLAGTGEEGITVVNASEFPKEFAMMNEVNDQQKLLVKINARGKAPNSDHYFFSEKGVPAFFFYTLGGIKAYHNIFDIAATLPLTEYEDLFKLLISFNEKLMGK